MTGQAKSDYMREYMRKKRGLTVHKMLDPVRPNLVGPLSGVIESNRSSAINAPVAQRIEHRTSDPRVAGSNPARRAI